MSHARINRYIRNEISIPVILSLLIFTFVLLMGRIPRLTELVVSKGVPAGEIVLLFSYLLPTFFSITVPLSFLLGILLAFGRLSADSEFIALKASGVSLYSLLRPVLVMAILFSMLTAWLTISVEPAGKTAFRSKIFEIASSRASVGIRPGIFNDDFEGLVLYTRDMDERQGVMKNVFISDEREGETPATIVARTGRFIPNPENYSLTLRLSNGTIHRRPANEKKATYQIIGFSNYDINLDIGKQLSPGQERHRSRGELSWTELDEAYRTSDNEKARYKFSVEKHKRIAIAFAPLVFALVGVPLGLQSHRSGKGAGFAMALGISLIYYLLLSIASTLAGKGTLPAAIALWLPNGCFLLGGAYFLHRTAIERPMTFLSWPTRLFAQLRNMLRKAGGRS
jgi:lipopolysaccharide export system permease protein